MEKTCKYCNQFFCNVSGRWFSNHVRWCDKSPKSSNTENIKKAIRKSYDERLGKLKEFNVICHKCQKIFIIEERTKLHPKKEQYFCSRACANSRILSNDTKNKISKALAAFKQPRQKRLCLECNQEFEVRQSSKKRFCSRKCAADSRKSSNEFLAYRCACKFDFNVWDYPEEFDLNLIYEYGWYKPKNRGDNLDGVSRDHKISIKFGWENNLDSKIMKHPCNCKLMPHSKNISKHKKCSLTVEQLKNDIKEWNKKYKS